MNTNDTLSKNSIVGNIRTSIIGCEIEILATVDSTNQYLKENDTFNKSNGYVVIADEQTKGKGRRGRFFFSQKGQGIYLSVLLKLGKEQQDIKLLTICAAVAVSRAIEKVCDIRADIKWVNDIFCNGKKICGILTEATISAELQEISSVIVGIGINTGTIPDEIADIATSILKLTGVRGIRNKLISEVLNEFEEAFFDYVEKGNVRDIIGYYSSRLFITGMQVYLPDIAADYIATVVGVSDIGALIVKDDGGDVMHITTGEIVIKWE